jgi:hypothetical protein
MVTAFQFQKTNKEEKSFWTSVDSGLPSENEGLYLVVQKFADGQQVVGLAWYRKDGDGVFHFSKGEVTHWAPAPQLP